MSIYNKPKTAKFVCQPTQNCGVFWGIETRGEILGKENLVSHYFFGPFIPIYIMTNINKFTDLYHTSPSL